MLNRPHSTENEGCVQKMELRASCRLDGRSAARTDFASARSAGWLAGWLSSVGTCFRYNSLHRRLSAENVPRGLTAPRPIERQLIWFIRNNIVPIGLAGCWGDVDGGGRIRIRQLAGGYGECGPCSRTQRKELAGDHEFELAELASIYVARGLDNDLARQVAQQLMAHDVLGAHARDELGISDVLSARPVQAALASAGTFAVGAAMPLLTVFVSPERSIIPMVSGSSLLFLAILGGLSAYAGGASIAKGAMRVTFWGALAMALTAGVGALFGIAAQVRLPEGLSARNGLSWVLLNRPGST